MFRVSQYIKELISPTPISPKRNPPGPVVIWNLVRQCNLACKHCYTNSANFKYPNELTLEQIYQVMDSLKDFKVPVLMLSGGEPLLHPHIFSIARRSKEIGFYTGLSTNGTLIGKHNIDKINEIGFDYVGISLDGIGSTHDQFRRVEGAFDASLNGIRLCRSVGIKVGIRYCLTQDTASSFGDMLKLMESEDINKFYLSHLNYAGRGRVLSARDAHFDMTRKYLSQLFDYAYESISSGHEREFVTGNNDADGVFFLKWVEKNFPNQSEHIRQKLVQWGGNSTGINIGNIDNEGNVHPDSFWWSYSLGNVKERKFGDIWNDTSDELMAGLKKYPRAIEGRCSKCSYFDICGGNTRVRAYEKTKNFWAEDPGCYLEDAEIGVHRNSAFSEGLNG